VKNRVRIKAYCRIRRVLPCGLRQFGCPECDGLWLEYSATTIEHIALENKLKIAVLEHAALSIEVLTAVTEMAAIAPNSVREKIHKHEVNHGKADADESTA